MNRKKMGGATIKRSDIEVALSKNDGILFKIPNPLANSGVNLEVYGAKVTSTGIHPTNMYKCTLGSCSIKKTNQSPDTNKYEYEHCAEFSIFNPGEPFFAFFSRSQIEMLFTLGKFDEAFISSYMPQSSNPIANLDEIEPNFSLEIQPLKLPVSSKTGIGLPQTLRAAGCPRTWTQ